jgi:hypothetical protein
VSIAIHVDRNLDAGGKAFLADGCHGVAVLLDRGLGVFFR